MTIHSKLGASGAERWMNCPGSVALLTTLDLPETDEPEYRSKGTSAHSIGYEALISGKDAWEFAGEQHGKHEVDVEIMDAVQVYIDECRSLITPTAKVFHEFSIDYHDFDAEFFGTLDFGIIDAGVLRIRDYKHGAGIAVDVEGNPQLMYYGYGLLRHNPEAETVELGIVQPRAFHPAGPIRTWSLSAGELREWATTILKPAMVRARTERSFDAGPWCRFCPAKLVCPLMVSLFGAAANHDPKEVVALDDSSIGRSYQYTAAVRSYLKALEEETLRRLIAGTPIDGVKLVSKRSNRIWKDGAEAVLTFADAYTTPVLKSPAQLEVLGPAAKKLTAEWAYSPVSGYTVALASDKRPAVKAEPGSAVFGAVVV